MLKEKHTLFDALNSYHPDIKFKLEQNPKKFLDTKIIKETNKQGRSVTTLTAGVQHPGFTDEHVALQAH